MAALLGPPSSKTAVNGRLRYRACAKCANSVGIVNVIVNTFLMIMKGYLGIVGRSTALVADAIHSSADVVSSVMLVFGLRVARRPADKRYPFGYGKVEFLVAVVIYSSLISAGVVIFIDAISTIVHREQVSPSMATLWGAVISIIVNEMMFRQSVCAGSQLKSPSMVANAWEKRSDAFSSGAVFVGIAGAMLGWHFMDPLAAILVAVYILKFSCEMLWEAFKGLLDTALDSKLVEGVRRSAGSIEGVLGIEAIRSREIGQNVWIDLEILVDGDAVVEDVNRIKDEVRQAVSKEFDRPSNVFVYLKPATA
jgi:cation diffusion facilitator family transporter